MIRIKEYVHRYLGGPHHGLISNVNPSLKRLEKYVVRLFFLIPALLYISTACRSPGWLDATLIVSNVYNLNLGSWVNFHNLFHVLGHLWLQLFPSQNIYYYLVLLSALCGVVTVYLMFLVGMELTSNITAAALGSLVLMISHSLWWHSTVLEVYTTNTAIMAAMLLCIVRYNRNRRIIYLYITAFLFGLGWSNHMLMGLFLFALVLLLCALLFLWRTITVKHALLLILCAFLGFQLFFVFFVIDYRREFRIMRSREPNQSVYETRVKALKQTIHYATGGEFSYYMFPEDVTRERKRFWRFNYPFLILFNYPSAAFFLAIFGLYCFWKRKFYRLTFLFYMVGIVAQIIWSSNYWIWDMYAFALPVYVLLSLPIMLSLDYLMKQSKATRAALLFLVTTFIAPLFIYRNLDDWNRKPGIVQRYFENYPEIGRVRNTWDAVEYWANPNKFNYHRVSEYAQKIFDTLPQDAHFWNSDDHSDYALTLYYQNIYNVRPDINHHSLFSVLMTHEEVKGEAHHLKSSLEFDLPVYFATLEYPERLVLDQLYLLYHGGDALDRVGSLPTDEFVNLFQDVDIEKIVLFEQEQIYIYRVRKREPL